MWDNRKGDRERYLPKAKTWPLKLCFWREKKNGLNKLQAGLQCYMRKQPKVWYWEIKSRSDTLFSVWNFKINQKWLLRSVDDGTRWQEQEPLLAVRARERQIWRVSPSLTFEDNCCVNIWWQHWEISQQNSSKSVAELYMAFTKEWTASESGYKEFSPYFSSYIFIYQISR